MKMQTSYILVFALLLPQALLTEQASVRKELKKLRKELQAQIQVLKVDNEADQLSIGNLEQENSEMKNELEAIANSYFVF